MSQASHQASSKAFKRSRAHGLAMSGLVFYLVHILQQAQARDTDLLAETMTVQDDGVYQDDEMNDAVTVASVETLEPVFIESTPSQSIETTVVVDEEETSEEVMNGKDAVDVSDGGVSPLLILGGVALLGGGIALAVNDNDSDDSTVTTSDQEPELVYETGIVTLTGIPMVGQTVSLERVVDEDAEVNSSDDENIFKDVVWVSDSGDIVSRGDSLLFTEELESQSIYARGLMAIDGVDLPFSTSPTNPRDAEWAISYANSISPDSVPNHEWSIGTGVIGNPDDPTAVYRLGDLKSSNGYDGFAYGNYGFNHAAILQLETPIMIPNFGETVLSFDMQTAIESPNSFREGWDGVLVQGRNGDGDWLTLSSESQPYSFTYSGHDEFNSQGFSSGWAGIGDFEVNDISLDAFSGSLMDLRFVFLADEYFSGYDKLSRGGDVSEVEGVTLSNIQILNENIDILNDEISTEGSKFEILQPTSAESYVIRNVIKWKDASIDSVVFRDFFQS